MRLHPVSWLLVAVLAFVVVDAALQTAGMFVIWRGGLVGDSPGAFGFLLAAFFERVGSYAIDSLAWTAGAVVWLEILWRTLRGLRLRRHVLLAAGNGQ